MAELLLTPDNPGPVNEGEARVVQRLVDELPDGFVVIPNLEVPVHGGLMVEIDALVLGPDIAWVVEVKDHAPDVEINQHSYLVGGMPRGHAVKVTRRKCQQLHTRMAAIGPQLGWVWFQPLVVLAQQPAGLAVAAAMEPFVRLIDDASHLIANPSLIGLYKDPINPATFAALRQHLADEATHRPPRFDSDMYVGTQLIAKAEGWELWLGEHKVFKETVELHIRHVPAGASPAEREQLRQRALHPAVLGHRVAKHPNVAAPKDPFFLEDGSAVLVVPERTLPTIGELAEDSPDAFDAPARRKVLLGVCRTIDYCHRRGVALRALGPDSILVTSNGAPIVTGFLYAHTGVNDAMADTPRNWDTLVPSDWQAPEQTAGKPVSFATDLWFVGHLARTLFPDGVSADVDREINDLLAEQPDQRPESLAPLIDTLAPAATSTAPQVVDPAEGAVFGERYELRSLIGQGGFAQVWEAYDKIQRVDVAIKIFDTDEADDDVRSECAILQSIALPGVVKIRDATVLNGRWLIVMERLYGHGLDSLVLAGQLSERQRLSEPEVVQIGINLLSTLAALHPDVKEMWSTWRSGTSDGSHTPAPQRQSGKLVHRDIKPQNVIMVEGRGPVLIDFGLAAFGAAASVGVGTPGYQPPDAIQGGVDPDLDLYAVGVTLCELLGGRVGSGNASRSTIQLPQHVSAGLSSVLTQATHPKRTMRFRDAADFIAALVGLDFPTVTLPTPPVDVITLQADIWQAVRDRDLDQARAICPATWTSILERIDELEALITLTASSPPISEAHGFRLVHRGDRAVPEAVDTDNATVSNAQVSDYVVEGPGGTTLELHVYAGTVDGEGEFVRRWVTSGEAFAADGPLRLLADGALRMSRLKIDGDVVLELAMAERRPDGKGRGKRKASLSELDAAAGVDVEDILRSAGALRVGTRAEVISDSSNRRNYLCARFHDNAPHALAVAYFVTRVLPLAGE